MLALATQNKDVLTYWAPSGQNDYGQATFETPVKMLGRWEDKIVLARTPEGDEFKSQAVVYVPEDLVVGGYLARGDHRTVSNPVTVGALEVKLYQSVPDLRSLERLRKAVL